MGEKESLWQEKGAWGVSLALSFPRRWLNFVFPLFLGRFWKESGGAGRALFRSEMRVDCGANPPQKSLACCYWIPAAATGQGRFLPWAATLGGLGCVEFAVGRPGWSGQGRASVGGSVGGYPGRFVFHYSIRLPPSLFLLWTGGHPLSKRFKIRTIMS